MNHMSIDVYPIEVAIAIVENPALFADILHEARVTRAMAQPISDWARDVVGHCDKSGLRILRALAAHLPAEGV